MFSDSLSILLERPADVTALQIQAWTIAQYRRPGPVIHVSTYLYHALKKIHVMGELELVAAEPLGEYIQELSSIVLDRLCPMEERERLGENLSALSDPDASWIAAVDVLHQPDVAVTPHSADGSM